MTWKRNQKRNRLIADKYLSGAGSYAALAREFGLSRRYFWDHGNVRAWKELPESAPELEVNDEL